MKKVKTNPTKKLKTKSTLKKNAVIKKIKPQKSTKAIIKKKKRILDKRHNLLKQIKNKPLSEKNISDKIVDKLVEDISDRTATAVIKCISDKVQHTFNDIHGAKNVILRFEAKKLLWVDPTSLQNYIIKCWEDHVKEELKIKSGIFRDNLYKMDLTIPEFRCKARMNKKNKTHHIDVDI